MVCLLNHDLFGFECGLGIPEQHTRTQYGGGMALGMVPINQAPPAGLPIGKRRTPESLEEWDTRLSKGDHADILCDGPCGGKRKGNEGAFRDRRMREAGPAGRAHNWGTAACSAAWNCGICWLRELPDRGYPHVTDPAGATALVRRTPAITESDDRLQHA